jgi:hypothetical protein
MLIPEKLKVVFVAFNYYQNALYLLTLAVARAAILNHYCKLSTSRQV